MCDERSDGLIRNRCRRLVTDRNQEEGPTGFREGITSDVSAIIFDGVGPGDRESRNLFIFGEIEIVTNNCFKSISVILRDII